MRWVRHIILSSIIDGVIHRKIYWLKILFISTIILLILFVNFFVLPLEWNTKVMQFERARYDFGITNTVNFQDTVSNNFTISRYVGDVLDALESKGLEPSVSVLVILPFIPELGGSIAMVSNLSRLDYTIFANVIYRYRDSDEGVYISHRLSPGGELEVRDGSLVIRGVEVPILGFITSEYSVIGEINYLSEVLGFAEDPLNNPQYLMASSMTLYIAFDEPVDKTRVLDAIVDLLYRYNSTGIIMEFASGVDDESPTDFLRRMADENVVISRVEMLDAIRDYFYSQYLNPLSSFTLFSVGSLVVYIMYLTKSGVDISRDNLDAIGVIYSVGGGDRHVYLYILTYLYIYLTPSIMLGLAAAIYWVRMIYRLYLPIDLLLSWLSPLVLTPMIIVSILTPLITTRYVVRKGLAEVLSKEFG